MKLQRIYSLLYTRLTSTYKAYLSMACSTEKKVLMIAVIWLLRSYICIITQTTVMLLLLISCAWTQGFTDRIFFSFSNFIWHRMSNPEDILSRMFPKDVLPRLYPKDARIQEIDGILQTSIFNTMLNIKSQDRSGKTLFY